MKKAMLMVIAGISLYSMHIYARRRGISMVAPQECPAKTHHFVCVDPQEKHCGCCLKHKKYAYDPANNKYLCAGDVKQYTGLKNWPGWNIACPSSKSKLVCDSKMDRCNCCTSGQTWAYNTITNKWQCAPKTRVIDDTYCPAPQEFYRRWKCCPKNKPFYVCDRATKRCACCSVGQAWAFNPTTKKWQCTPKARVKDGTYCPSGWKYVKRAVCCKVQPNGECCSGDTPHFVCAIHPNDTCGCCASGQAWAWNPSTRKWQCAPKARVIDDTYCPSGWKYVKRGVCCSPDEVVSSGHCCPKGKQWKCVGFGPFRSCSCK